MSDIKHYNTQQNTEHYDDESQKEYSRRIRRHKRKNRLIIIGAMVIAILVIFILCFVRYKATYSSYTVKSSKKIEDAGYAQYIKMGEGYARYTRDGVSWYSYAGSEKWKKSYEINNPIADACGDYLAIANREGNEVNLFDADGHVATITTALPILQMNVSKQGLVVASLKDEKATYINMYNKDSSKIYSIKTTFDGDGIPVSIAVSDDGTMLIVSYTALNGDNLKTSVVFYNFDSVGQGENERIVAGFDTYGDQIVSNVQFLGTNRAVAFGENVISFFSVSEYPKHIKDIEIDRQIDKVFYSSKYVGIAHTNEDGDSDIIVYNSDGKQLFSNTIDAKYDNYIFAKSALVVFGGTDLQMYNESGKKIYDDEFSGDVNEIIPIGDNDQFIVVYSDKIEKIKLKHGG